MQKIIFTILALMFAAASFAQDAKIIQLKKPQLKKGLPVMEALQKRKSVRSFADKELDMQTVSNLLWAANGVNRPEEKKRTAPSAMNRQEIDVYICLKDGAYFYDAFENALKKTSADDCRLLNAPATIFLVANAKEGERFADMDAGIVSQNISIFAAGTGLATVVRASMPPAQQIRAALALKESQLLKLNMPVGYEK